MVHTGMEIDRNMENCLNLKKDEIYPEIALEYFQNRQYLGLVW